MENTCYIVRLIKLATLFTNWAPGALFTREVPCNRLVELFAAQKRYRGRIFKQRYCTPSGGLDHCLALPNKLDLSNN